MCRMIAFASKQLLNVDPYFQALKEQAQHGKNSPHKDGWGVALYGENDFTLKKSEDFILHVTELSVQARMAVLHARKSSSTGASVFFSHPFVYDFREKIWAFAHNGIIKGLPTLFNGEIDTQVYYRIFIDELRNGDPIEAMRRTVEKIRSEGFEYTSLNAFVANGSQLCAFRITSKRQDAYHTIFYKRSPDTVVISTEQFGNGWAELENESYIITDITNHEMKVEVGKIF